MTKHRRVRLVEGPIDASAIVASVDTETRQACMLLASCISKLLDKRNRNVSGVAESIGVEAVDLARICNGDLSGFTVERLKQIAEKLIA
jgi:hypothetical protein